MEIKKKEKSLLKREREKKKRKIFSTGEGFLM